MSSFGTAVAESLARAQQMLRTRRYAQALQICTQALARGVDDPQLRLIAAHSLLAQSLQQRAKQEAQQVLRLDPGQAEAHRLLADIAQAEGQVGTACEHLQCVLELDPADEHARTVSDTLSRWAGGAPGGPRANQGVSQLSLRVTSIARFIEGFDRPDLVDVARSSESGSRPITDSMIQELASQDLGDPLEPTPTPTQIDGESTRIDAESGPLMASLADLAQTVQDEPRTNPAGWEPGAVADVSSPLAGAGFDQTLGLPAVAEGTEHEIVSDNQPTELRDRSPVASERGAEEGSFDPMALLTAQSIDPADLQDEDSDDEPTYAKRKAQGAGRPESVDELPRLDVGGLEAISSDGLADFEVEPASAPVAVEHARAVSVPSSAAAGAQDAPAAVSQAAPAAATSSSPTPAPAVSVDPLAITDRDRPGDLAATDPSAGFESKGPAGAAGQRALNPLSAGDADSGVSVADPMMDMLTGGAGSAPLGSAGPAVPPQVDRAAQTQQSWDPLAEAEAQHPTGVPAATAPQPAGSAGDHQESWDPLAEAEGATARGGDLPSGQQPALASADSVERELMAAGIAAPPRRRRGRLRLVVALITAFLLGAGGLYGFLVYRNYAYVKSEWVKVRRGLLLGSQAGLHQATAAAKRVLAKRANHKEAQAAVGMCDAAAAFELGDDRLQSAKAQLDRSKGSDSEWRTVAGGYLALMDDPALAVGYLKKGTEVYPKSAVLRYLHGRALAAAGEADAAQAAYRAVLKSAPGAMAAKVALARLIEQQAAGSAKAIALYDELLKATPDHVQALLARARLRSESGGELDLALADAQRVSVSLKDQASVGQRGWANLLIAKVARSKGDVKQMSSALDLAISAPPCCDDEFSYEVAGQLESLFRFSEAYEQMKRALARQPKRPAYLRRMGRILLALSKPKQAEPYISAAPAHEPPTKLLRGRLAFALGRLNEAGVALEEAARHKPSALEAQVFLALTRAKQGNRGGAISALRALRARNPRVDVVPQALGRVYLWAADYAKAEAALKKAWQLNALDPLTPTLMGYVSLARQDMARARKRFERALQERPNYALAQIGLAELLRRTRHYGAAQAQAQKVLEADRGRPEYRLLQARIALGQGKLAEAESALPALKEAGVTGVQLQQLEGELALAAGKARHAADLLLRAQKAAPSDVELTVTAARALLKARRSDDAYDLLEDALGRDPGHPQALLELGRLALTDGEFQFAISRMAKSLAQMRQRQWPKSLQAEVYASMGAAFLSRKDTGRALTNLQDAIDLDPKAAVPNYLMGRTYARLERPKRAVPYYRRAIELDPAFAPSYLALGQVYQALGEKAAALEQLKAFTSKSRNRTAIARARRLMAKLR